MDELYVPKRSVRSSGLTVVTMRTPGGVADGIIGGEVGMAFGTAHAWMLDPRLQGMPHMDEHMRVLGASDRFKADEVVSLCRTKHFYSPNAATARDRVRFLTASGADGAVLTAENFWPVFGAVTDTVFRQRHDEQTIARERGRVLSEIKSSSSAEAAAERAYWSAMFGAEHLALGSLGTPKQVKSYTQKDFRDFGDRSYTLGNAAVFLVGDVHHARDAAKVDKYLKDIRPGKTDIPVLPPLNFQQSEHRWISPSANKGSVEAWLNFPAVNVSDEKSFATGVAIALLSAEVGRRIKDKYKLYSAFTDYDGWWSEIPSAQLYVAGDKKVVGNALKYGLDLMLDPEIQKAVVDNHARGVGEKIDRIRTEQKTVQGQASALNDRYMVNAPLLSRQERIDLFSKTTQSDVAEILSAFRTDPMFLRVRGSADSVASIPTIDQLDAARTGARRRPKLPKPVSQATPSRITL